MCPRPRRNIDVEEVLATVPLMLAELAQVSDLGGKEGGMFCLMEESTGNLVIEPTEIGKITNGKKDKYREYCLEKATRLRSHRGEDHFLSWQSRDENHDMWGGAFSDGDHIWSLSGYTEEQDEALMIMSAHVCGRIMNIEPRDCAKVSDNRIILDNEYLFWIPKETFPDEEEE